jgi:hypothetical protein
MRMSEFYPDQSAGMTLHGITTSMADFWVHLFPRLQFPMVFWYRREEALAYATARKLPLTIGRSKDGQPTGAGYLIPRRESFIHQIPVPRRYLENHRWEGLTDREAGKLGELVMRQLVEDDHIQTPRKRCCPLQTRQSQLHDATDVRLQWLPDWSFEFKTEMLDATKDRGNLYVQVKEHNHQPELYRDELGGVHERHTDMGALEP